MARPPSRHFLEQSERPAVGSSVGVVGPAEEVEVGPSVGPAEVVGGVSLVAGGASLVAGGASLVAGGAELVVGGAEHLVGLAVDLKPK